MSCETHLKVLPVKSYMSGISSICKYLVESIEIRDKNYKLFSDQIPDECFTVKFHSNFINEFPIH